MDMNQFWSNMLSLQLIPFMSQNPVHTNEKLEDTPDLSSSKKYQRTWKKQEIESIFNRTTEYCKQFKKKIEDLTIKDYMAIGENFSQRPEQIMLKITEIHNSGTLRPGIWAASEDQLLTDLLHKGKERWGQIARIINKEVHSNLKVRSGKQCKERWNNYLNPSINRNPWTAQEDSDLLRLYREHGQKWSVIAKFIKNRTEGAVKNRIKSLINRIQQDLPNQHNLDTGIDEFIRRNAVDGINELEQIEEKEEEQ
jgi:hypothetical protein